jgi:hypothetical protein
MTLATLAAPLQLHLGTGACNGIKLIWTSVPMDAALP